MVGSATEKGNVCLSASHLHDPPKTFIGIKKQRKSINCSGYNPLTERHLLEQFNSSSANNLLLHLFHYLHLNSVNPSFIVTPIISKVFLRYGLLYAGGF